MMVARDQRRVAKKRPTTVEDRTAARRPIARRAAAEVAAARPSVAMRLGGVVASVAPCEGQFN